LPRAQVNNSFKIFLKLSKFFVACTARFKPVDKWPREAIAVKTIPYQGSLRQSWKLGRSAGFTRRHRDLQNENKAAS